MIMMMNIVGGNRVLKENHTNPLHLHKFLRNFSYEIMLLLNV